MPEMERQDSFKSVLRNVKRKLSTRERKQSKQENNPSSQLPGSLKCSPFSSNNNTPSRSPFLTPREIDENPHEETDSQDEDLLPVKIASAPVEHITAVVGPPRSPLPPDSPLLRSRTASPALQRARNFNKELRRQASFKAARERQSASRTNSPACSRNPSPARETESDLVSFKIKKKLGTRKGWIIMQDDEVECEAQDALKTVVQMIREMECQGFAIPEKITVKVN